MRTSYIVMIIMVVAVFSSCSTTEKFYVSGTPNTEIYTPSYTHIATVGTNGKAKIEIPSDNYYAFFLSKSPSSELYVPFALDYKKKGRLGTKLIEGTGRTLAGMGVLTNLAGVAIMLAAEDGNDIGGPMLAVGSGLTLAGMAIGMPAANRLSQTSYDYQYQYLNSQQTNEDLHFTKAVFNEPFKGASQTQTVKATPTTAKEGTSVNRKRLSEKSSKTLKDYGKQTEGMYVGNGTLTQNNEIIESYTDVKVNIERISKNEVYVNVIADGEEFFESPSKYKISKNRDGSYTLKHSSISAATITINKDGSLTYRHPKINIDGEIYVLKISAKR